MKHILLSIKEDKTYYLSGLTKEEIILFSSCRANKDFTTFNVKTEIIAEQAIKAGSKETATSSSIASYVTYLKGYEPSKIFNKTNPRKVQYRDYTRTEEAQLVNAHLVSICEDSYISASTALKAIKLPYIILWWKKN